MALTTPTRTLTAHNHERGLVADIVVPYDRTQAVRVHWQRGVGTDADLDELRRSARYLHEEYGYGARGMTLDSGWVIHA